MRRIVLAAAALAAMLGMLAVARRSRRDASAASPGVLPGTLGSWINAYMDRPLHAAVAEALDLQPDDELLDVACGAGYFLTESAAHVGRVAGIDLSAPKVDLARRRLADRIETGTAEIVQGDAGSLPWGDDRFTAVSCSDAFPFFPEPERVVSEMCRVLRPGGRAVIETGAAPGASESRQARGPAGSHWEWGETDLRRMAAAAGFGDVEFRAYAVADGHRLTGQLLRRVFGTDLDTIFIAIKPTLLSATVAVPEAEPVAVS
jgi:SAM-dependent methyltransferase